MTDTRFSLAAYESMAPDYDDWSSAHDYDRLMGIYEGLARRHGLAGDEVLDVACGTGKSFLPLLARGFRVTGCDLSPAMLDRAAAKAPEIELVAADMCDLPWRGAFDLVTCVDDALNHLPDETALRRAVAAAARALRPGGLYAFDVNTLRTHLEVFGRTACHAHGERFFTWEPHPPAEPGPGCAIEATLHVFAREADGRWRRTASRHRERHHPLPAVLAALGAAGLRPAGVHGLTAAGEVDDEADELAHHKLIVVARKGRPSPERR